MSKDMKPLPCPWCGEELRAVNVSEGSTFRWRKLDGCCADGPEVRIDTMADDQAKAEADARADAIKAWNERAPNTMLAEIERLRAEVSAFKRSWIAEKENAERLVRSLREQQELVEQLRVDAERYRFLAGQHGLWWEEELDAAIERDRAALDQEDKDD